MYNCYDTCYMYMYVHMCILLHIVFLLARVFTVSVDESHLEPGAHYAEVSVNFKLLLSSNPPFLCNKQYFCDQYMYKCTLEPANNDHPGTVNWLVLLDR